MMITIKLRKKAFIKAKNKQFSKQVGYKILSTFMINKV